MPRSRGAIGDAERRAALDNILAGCDRAAHAIDQLLTLARLDPGDPRERREPCDLRAVAKAVLADLAPAAVAKGVDVELAPGAPTMIEGSPGLLGVLVRNLVDNAVRYSAAGANVRVDVVPGSQEIGTGLGLSIVRRIAELHRASVAFDDGPGGLGLSVVVTFPVS
jgi:signal transduction histidine kinase